MVNRVAGGWFPPAIFVTLMASRVGLLAGPTGSRYPVEYPRRGRFSRTAFRRLKGAAMFVDRLVRIVLPRQDQFFTLLEEIAGRITASAEVFAELATVSGHDRFKDIAARMKPLETEADKLCHRVYEELDRTFVTPIDREDLAHLTKALDDVI